MEITVIDLHWVRDIRDYAQIWWDFPNLLVNILTVVLMRILVCWIAYPTASNLPLLWIPEFYLPLCLWIGIVVMWIDFCYLFLQFEYLFFPIGSGVSVVLQQQKVWLSNKNMAERQTLDQQHAVESQSPSASKEDMITYVMALEAALLPCLPARELQAIDRSPHPSHQSEPPCTLSKLTQFFYMHVVQSSRINESCGWCCMWERVWIGSEKPEGDKSELPLHCHWYLLPVRNS